MNAMKKLMAVLRIVPTPLDHILVAVILATALVVMDTPAMVLIIFIDNVPVRWGSFLS